MPFVILAHEGRTKKKKAGRKRLTSQGKDEDTYGDDPRHSAVALPKLFHQVLEKHTQALEGPIGADLHQEEGCSHSPTPATIRHLWVNIWTQTTLGIGYPHGYRRSSRGRNRNDISEFISRLIVQVINSISYWFGLSVRENETFEDVTLGSESLWWALFIPFYYVL